MEPYVIAAIVFAGLVVVSLGVQLALHVSRWRGAGSRTDGDYREAPRVTEGAVAIRWDVVGVSVLASLWAVCTYAFAAAGSLLALMLSGESDERISAALLAVVVLSGIAQASFALRASSRLVRRHDGTARSSTRSAVHGVVHHAAVLLFFLGWSAHASSRDLEQAAMMLTPICAFGALVSVAVHFAGRRAAIASESSRSDVATERPVGGLAPQAPA